MAKAKKRVPKRIAGVKVPKPVRRGLKQLARSQKGRLVVTEALLAAGAALAASQVQPGSATRRKLGKALPQVQAGVAKAKGDALGSGARLSLALTAALAAFTERLKDPHPSGVAISDLPPAPH